MTENPTCLKCGRKKNAHRMGKEISYYCYWCEVAVPRMRVRRK